MITTNYFKTLLPEIVHLISGKLPLSSALAFSACCKRLNKLAGRHFWEDMCKEYHIHLDERKSPRFKFIVELNNRNPSKLLKFGNFLFYHVGDIKLAITYYERARELCTSPSGLIDSIQDQIDKIHYLHDEKNTSSQSFFSSMSNYLFPVTENTNKDTKELEVLKTIKQFRMDVLSNLMPGIWEKYDDLDVTKLSQISPEIALQATSFYCYLWATRNLPTNGKQIFNKLIETPNLPYSIKKRIEILKATRQLYFSDEGLKYSQSSLILKKACKNKNICLTERLLAQYHLIAAKILGQVVDKILTVEECCQLAKEMDSYNYQIHEITRLYIEVISQTKLERIHMTHELMNCYYEIAYVYKGKISKTLLYYCQIFEIKRFYAGFYTCCNFEKIHYILNTITQDPPTSNYGVIRTNQIISETNDLLSKWTELKSMNFDKLSYESQRRILTSKITDTNELIQEINLSLVKSHFNDTLFSPFSDVEVLEMLKKIVAPPLDGDKNMISRWEDRARIAFRYLKKYMR